MAVLVAFHVDKSPAAVGVIAAVVMSGLVADSTEKKTTHFAVAVDHLPLVPFVAATATKLTYRHRLPLYHWESEKVWKGNEPCRPH